MTRAPIKNYTKTFFLTLLAVLMVAIACLAHVQTAWAASTSEQTAMMIQTNDASWIAAITLLSVISVGCAIGGIIALRTWKRARQTASKNE